VILPEWCRSNAVPAPEYCPEKYGENVVDFLRWYGANSPGFPMSPPDGFCSSGGLLGLTLYRSGQFQVQLFLFPAGTVVPPHRHPNVDTIEMHLDGDYDFRVGGVSAIPLDHLHDRRGLVSRWWGRGVLVKSSDWHDLTVNTGAAFLSVQHWLSGTPGTVGNDWEGEPVNAIHGQEICKS
jgi:hypothetical protein